MAQEEYVYEFSTDVYIDYPYLSIPRTNLEEAITFRDLNRHHKSSWIASYKSVELITYQNGKQVISPGVDSILTVEQKNLLSSADFGSEITAKIRYMPKNKMRQNEEHDMNFTFTVDPEKPASFNGGKEALNKYLHDNVTKLVSMNSFRQHQLAAVKFTINEKGQIVNPHIFQKSENPKADKILLDAVCNMPLWNPAQYANGEKVSQNHVLTAGDINSCVVNLVNIRVDLEDIQAKLSTDK